MQTSNIAEAVARIARMRSQNQTDTISRDQIRANIALLKKDATLRQLEINLREKGINPSDPTWQRIVAQGVSAVMGSQTGKTITQNIKDIGKGMPTYMKGRKPYESTWK